MSDFFIIPVLDHYLFYAPLNRYARILDCSIVEQLQQSINNTETKTEQDVMRFVPQLKHCATERIRNLQGPLTAPLFLGLITTRGCNMGCRYCDFSAPKHTNTSMTLDIAQRSVDVYLSILADSGITRGQIEFFGGEPFFRNRIAEFVLGYARNRSAVLGIELQFKVTTNGIMSEQKCKWVADNFDSVVLSLDGPAVYQNKNRPLLNKNNSFNIVCRSAHILSAGNTDLIIRSCITESSVNQLPEIATFFAEHFVVDCICFESLSLSADSQDPSLRKPDPYSFALNYLKAQDTLSSINIDLMTSGTDIDSLQYSFCPVGKDAMIVTPEGDINACYLLNDEWEKHGLDLKIGKMQEQFPYFSIIERQLLQVRSYNNSLKYPLCQNCFAKYHCAGGCHVNHSQICCATEYDRLCTQVRLILVGKLLKRVKSYQLYDKWLKAIETKIETKSELPIKEIGL